MSNEPSPKPDSLRSNPQIIAAIIGGIVTIIVAIVGVVPVIINNRPVVVTATPAPTFTPEVPTATSPPAQQPVNIANTQPTLTPISLEATPQPTIPIDTSSLSQNVLLMYDDVSFTLLNQGTTTLSLEGVSFRSGNATWDARDWGPSVYNSIPVAKCLRMRDQTTGNRNPPQPCRGNNLYGLQLVGATAVFWRGVDSFEVVKNGQVIATCQTSDESCTVGI